MVNRKIPFSGKQKKEQLKNRRQRRQANAEERQLEVEAVALQQARDAGLGEDIRVAEESLMERLKQTDEATQNRFRRNILVLNAQPTREARVNRYSLQFCKNMLDKEFVNSKVEVHYPIQRLDSKALEYSSEDFFPPGLTYPQRPSDYRSFNKQKLLEEEEKIVRVFGEEMHKKFEDNGINAYEQNPETWRQLWRVMEKSDVLLYIVDVRFAVCQFAPYLYEKLRVEKRGVVLVMNKVDLVPATAALALKRYFKQKFSDIEVVCFCSRESMGDKTRKQKLALQSSRALIAAISKVAPDIPGLTDWKSELEREILVDSLDDFDISENFPRKLRGKGRRKHRIRVDSNEELVSESTIYGAVANVPPNRPFTIGTIGYPNAGKSSLINSIFGERKVGVSRTPGFTKHFQTHYLTPEKSVLLCDCPGLIFPATCPYKLQVLSGTFPVAQVRAPVAVVDYLAARLDLPNTLRIRFPQDYIENEKSIWTAYTICVGYAEKRQYILKGKGARADVSRAAIEILNFSNAAKPGYTIYLRPPAYSENLDELSQCSDELREIKLVQGVHVQD